MNAGSRVLLVGSAGQVAQACKFAAPEGIVLRAISHADLDIADAARVTECVEEFKPDVIINAAAYTAVDKAEADPDAARRGNTDGPRNLAAAASRLPHTRLVHLSTDFVFDGASSTPYSTDAPTHPLGVYGLTKLAGEQAVREALGERAVIIRTAWVYSATGNNFLRTMLRLMAKGAVRVVADQVGTPTAAGPLANAIWRAVELKTSGVLHWTDAGVASWYDFAVAIAEEAAQRGLLPATVPVMPIGTRDYPTPARRPAFSVLDKTSTIQALGIAPEHWRKRLRAVIEELASA